MTTVRRPTGEARLRSPQAKSIFTCRNVFLFLVLFQILSLLFSTLRGSGDGSTNNNLRAGGNTQGGGIEAVLKDFQKGLSSKGRTVEQPLGEIVEEKEPEYPESQEEQEKGDDDDNGGDDDEEKEKGGGDDDDEEKEFEDKDGKEQEEKGDDDEQGDDKYDNKEKAGNEKGGDDDENGGDDDKAEAKQDNEDADDDKADDNIDKEENIIQDNDDAAVDQGGVTAGGFMRDFSFERKHPSFRKDFKPQVDKDLKKVQELSKEQGITPCTYYSDKDKKTGKASVLLHSECLRSEKKLIAYNSQSFPRIWCGKTIAPYSVERFDGHCREPIHLFSVDNPTATADEMPPIVIRSSTTSQGNLEDVDCNVPCKQEQNMAGDQRVIEGTIWEITSTKDNPHLKAEPTAYRRDKYYSTTSFKSSIPQSFFSFDEYNLMDSTKIDFDSAENAASYMINDNCRSQQSKRQKWYEGIRGQMKVSSFGKCNHDTETELNMAEPAGRIELMKNFRVHLAFEAAAEKDHITEQVWEALKAGTVPVVVGAPNIMEHVPKNSVISASSFTTYEDLGKYVKKVCEDKTLWESFHEWRSQPEQLEAFKQRYEFLRTSVSCRTCRWAYAKTYGLGWNHTTQVVEDLPSPRKMCGDTDGLVLKPFREVWATVEKGKVGKKTAPQVKSACEVPAKPEATINLEGYKMHRQASSHDGVIDLAITSIEKGQENRDIVLRLETQVMNEEGAHFRNPHIVLPTVHGALASSISFQDQHTRLTVICNWGAQMSSPQQGIVEIVINRANDNAVHEDETRSIRLIMEGVNALHDKSTEFFPSSYLQLMANDFLDPLQLFQVQGR